VSNSDQKNIDLILLTIGVLIGVAVGLFVIARDVSNENMARMQQNDARYQVAVNRRIAPIGRVVLDGELVEDPDVASVVEAEAAPTLMTGPQVYNAACLACHGGGIGGAPKTGDKADWGGRIAQGMDVLSEHAVDGFTGAVGFMPPKGGRIDLSDEEIIGAVKYLVDQVQ
jgi:cytochrome c5